MNFSATAGMLVCLLGLVLTFLPAQDGKNPPTGWSERCGAVLPRPADPEQRRARGYKAPRDPTVILAELDAMAIKMKPIAERYAIGAFPTLWIIDRKGVLREAVDRAADAVGGSRTMAPP